MEKMPVLFRDWIKSMRQTGFWKSCRFPITKEPEQIPETPDLEETLNELLDTMQLSAVFSNTTASFTAICSIRN